jgi:dihydropteroate synthase
MGIVNVTPDSFSDGGTLAGTEAALQRAEDMVAQGAGIIDVGGESTRPGAAAVSTEEELARVLPFVQAAAGRLPVPISVDTRSAAVADACLSAGAAVINDVSALAHDPEMAGTAARAGAGVVLMHMRGTPATMTDEAEYGDVVRDVAEELGVAVARARAGGVHPARIVVDPGIGFAKTAEQSLALLGDLSAIQALGFPVLVGPSRKSFLGAVLGVPAAHRLHGTVAACVTAYLHGAWIFRVHDVEPVVQALQVASAIREAAHEATPRRSP